MPSKTAQLIVFFCVMLLSLALHRYVYANLKKVLLRDYPKMGARLVRLAMTVFLIMDSPFIFLFLKSRIHEDLSTLTRILIYPFSVWQAVMILWAILLVPVSVWRRRELLGGPIALKIVKRVSQVVRKKKKDIPDTYDTPILEVVTD